MNDDLLVLYCPTCDGERLAECPPCPDGHGAECPDRACAECGTALLLDAPLFAAARAGVRPGARRRPASRHSRRVA